MKITWTGRHVELSPAQAQKLEGELSKVGKILDTSRGEIEPHFVLKHERHLHHAEVRFPYHHHELVGEASDPDLFAAIHGAAAKLESQAIRMREKFRDSRRGAKDTAAEA